MIFSDLKKYSIYPMIIQILSAIVGLGTVFVLPLINKPLAGEYFYLLSISTLIITLITPLVNIILKSEYGSKDSRKSYTVMLINGLIASSIAFLALPLSEFIFVFALSTMIFYLSIQRALLIKTSDLNFSYILSLLKTNLIGVAILSLVFFELDYFFYYLPLFLFILYFIMSFFFFKTQNVLKLERLSFSDMLNFELSSIYLSLTGLCLWIIYHMYRVSLFDFIEIDLITYVQSISIPLFVFSVVDSKGPYLLSFYSSNGQRFIYDTILTTIVFVVAWTSSYFFIFSFIIPMNLFTLFLDSNIFNSFFAISLLFSLSLNVIRVYYTNNTEFQTFIAFLHYPLFLILIFIIVPFLTSEFLIYIPLFMLSIFIYHVIKIKSFFWNANE